MTERGKEMLKERLRHLILALLLSVGLVMPLSGALDETLLSPTAFAVIGGVVAVFELASLHRVSAWLAAGLAATAFAGWVFAANGAQILSDAGIAVSLRMKGIRTAVPLAAGPLSVILSAGITLLCCFAVLQRATCIPALILCTAAAFTVWLTDSMPMLPWLLPALAAVLTLLLTSRYDDTSALRVLPWAACITALAFLLTGSGTGDNPLKEKADEIRQAILDRLFFTEARDVFSLYSVGFSPQGIEQLGGKPNPSDHPVMQVSTPKTVYLRGTVYNRYTGHGWQNTTGGRRYLWQSRVMAETRSALFDESLPPSSVQNSLSTPETVSVRMLSDSASTLFVPQRIRELNPGGETVPYFSNSSEVFITRNVQAGDTWEVTAPLYCSTDPGIGTLTDICATMEDPRWNTVCSIYLELPGHLEKPVAELAEEITSVAETPFDKAMALQNWLLRNYRYTMDVGEHPENIDFVTSFLLDTKKGYCTYFASAMTVLCRMAGLPARYVEGYIAEPNEAGEALVTGLNAHAWTEVYFSGFGWLTFDATPGQHAGKPNGENKDNTPQSTPTPEPPEPSPEPDVPDKPDPTEKPGEKDPEPSENPSEIPDNPPSENPPDLPELTGSADNRPKSFPWWLLLLAAAVAVSIRIRITSPQFRDRHAKSETERFNIWTDEITALLRSEQLERRTGETPMSFARRVDRTAMFSENISPAGECLSLIRYSQAEPLSTDTGLMRDTAMLIHGELSRQARIRYGFRRFFSWKNRRNRKQRSAES